MDSSDSTHLPPAGWYPDGQGSQRWWDGNAWTERVQDPVDGDAPAGEETLADQTAVDATDGSPSSPDRPTSDPVAENAPASTPAVERTASNAFYTKKWFVGVAAAVVGLIIGAAVAGTGSVEDDPKFQDVASQLEDANSDLESTKQDLTTAQAAVGKVDDREAALDKREAQIKEDEATVKSDAKSVLKREKAVGIVEKDIESNTISGDGIYEAGKDIKAGTYKTKGGADCYYAVLRDTKGGLDSIVNNNNISGSGILTISDGQFLELAGCSEWVRQ